MTPKERRSRLISLVVGGLSCVALDAGQPARDDRRPLDVGRVLAARYPESPIMSYIPGLAWASALRLAQLTGEGKWKEKPRRDMQPFLIGTKPAIAQPYLLTNLAGHLALSDLGAIDGDKKATALAKDAADYILTMTPAEFVRFRRNWTDDMFMASTLLSRVAAREKEPKYGDAIGRLLTTYAETLQRSDGLFIHAVEGPYAWGRGNGFALLGLTEALTYLPDDWSHHARVLEIYRTHVRALLPHQSDDGSWRQVVDEPSSYRELTVTAMTVAAMARGVRRGWLEKDVTPAIDRGWQAVLARVNADGTLKDVCAGTGAGPTKEYYLNRPAVNGADDRGGAMALLAAIEMAELRR
jgi:unsaturated rhamnogalacturonyl hydrolase